MINSPLFNLRSRPDKAIKKYPSDKANKLSTKSRVLNNAKLVPQLTVILRFIKFSAESVGTVVTIWSIDFLPS
jgi:hypothetical protein